MPEHPNPWRSQPPTSISSLLPSFARSTEEGRYANSTCFAVLLCSAPHGSEYKGRRQRPVRPQPAGGGSGCLSPAEEGERLGGIWRRTARGFGLICSACGVFVSFRLVSLSIGVLVRARQGKQAHVGFLPWTPSPRQVGTGAACHVSWRWCLRRREGGSQSTARIQACTSTIHGHE